MKKLFKDQKAGSNAITFLVCLMILMFTLVYFVEPIRIAYTQWAVSMAYKKGMDKVQQTGGLTAEIEDQLKNYTKLYGLDPNKLQVDGTIGTVNWGDDVSLDLKYNLIYKAYTWQNILAFKSQEKSTTIEINGSTSSYYFNNN